jgi:parallel beta-helix repeat protein
MILTIFLLGLLGVTFEIQKIETSGTIYIRADGSIDPPTAPITNVGNVAYTFFNGISDPLIVERDNIVVDGAGYTIQTAFYQIGIALSYRSNVTVKNTVVRNAFDGIYLNYTSIATLIDNNIMNNWFGIVLHNSSNCRISGNSVTSNQYDGIQLYYSSDGNSISENNIVANKNNGIAVSESSSNNTISRNNVRNSLIGINVNDFAEIDRSINNTISENNVTNNGHAGINLESSFNTVVGNSLSVNNGTGIYLLYSSNTVSRNNITENGSDGIYLDGSFNTVSGNNVSTNNGTGIYIIYSSDNTIFENNIANNLRGISLTYLSGNNTLYRNNLTQNDCGIYFYSAHNNSIFHNNLIDNTRQIEGEYFMNTWDNSYPSGGNYWSDYTGYDSDYDGIGDTPYFIDANNQDNYPLMGMFSSFNTSYGYAVDFVSNSSISDFSFNLSIDAYQPEAILAFNVSGETGTEGFLRICIPKVLINGSYVIMFDGEIITNTTWPQVRELQCSNETYEYLYINYTHSKHRIEVGGTTTIPEFPSFLILPLFMIATLLAVIVYKRKHALTLDRG